MSGNEPIAAEGTSAASADVSGSAWFDVTPGQVSMGIAVGAAFFSALLLSSLFALIWGVPSAVVVGIGVVLGRRQLITYGVGGLFVGIVIAGIQGSSPAVLVPCTMLALMAWDSGRYGLTIAEQLGEDARSTHLELGHAVLNGGIGIAGAALSYGVYAVTAGGQPVLALALLLAGIVVLIVTLDT